MNTNEKDQLRDTVAFLTARYRDDEEGAKAILGLGIDHDPTDAEMAEVSGKVVGMILSMTDFAIGQVKMVAMLLGVDFEQVMETIGIAMAIAVETVDG